MNMTSNGMSTRGLIVVAIVLAVIAGILLKISDYGLMKRTAQINSFEECKAAGNPILESYPEQCRTEDGRTFVNPEQHVSEEVSGGGGLGLQANGCAVAGCSGELCVSADEAGNVMSSCIYRPEFACYREASCEPQSGGACGWTLSASVVACLEGSALTTEEVMGL